jgi:hypothetical protein
MAEVKANVTIYLGAEVLARCRAAAEQDGRSLSNYLSGVLERAHPVTGVAMSLDEEVDAFRSGARSARGAKPRPGRKASKHR